MGRCCRHALLSLCTTLLPGVVTLTPASFRVCPFQVGALDGVVFGMKKPPFKDRRGNIVNQNAYFIHRKDKFGLLCVAICDYKRRFTWWDMSHVGSMHDWMAWHATPLGSAINEGALPHPYFINADSAFSVGPNMMVPFWCAKHGSAEDSWNYVQSQNRMAIECAFGILVRRWGILWRSLEMQWEKRTHVVSACMRLHNWCIDHNTGEDVLTESTGEDVTIAGNGERRRVSQHEVNQWLENDNTSQRGPKAAQNQQHKAKARREQMLAALLEAHPNHTDLRPKPADNVDRRKSKRDQRA